QRERLTIVHRLHPDARDCRREPARLVNDLAYEREPVASGPRPRRIVGRGRHRAGDLRGMDHIAHVGRGGRRERAHVLGEVPPPGGLENFRGTTCWLVSAKNDEKVLIYAITSRRSG